MGTTSASLLAALAGGPQQNARLLVLHTGLGPNVLVAERAEIDESIGPLPGDAGAVASERTDGIDADGTAPTATGFRIVVHALATDAHLELKRLIGQPVRLDLLTQASRTEMRPFHGHVTRISMQGADGGLARYRLVIEPWLGFLRHRRDAWVFQKKSVIQILEDMFSAYRGQGRVAPAWRFALADPGAYPVRSLAIQYQESDLAFVLRLLREEGLFFWFEHRGAPDDDACAPAFGAHTLVIADHNGAFLPDAQQRVRYTQPDAQQRVRYTQPGTVQPEDTLTRWRRKRATRTASVELASLDHRALNLRRVSERADPGFGAVPLRELCLVDNPGAYAYENAAQGARLALRQMQALDAERDRVEARGTLRSSAPGRVITLVDHPLHDGSDPERDRFVLLSVRHRARNNLHADVAAPLAGLNAAIARTHRRSAAGHTAHHVFGAAPERATERTRAQTEPLYECELTAQRAAVPVRPCERDARGLPDPRLNARPTAHGLQTAIVVGPAGAAVHTDRDQRVKIQFHWQRGSRAGHRLDAPTGEDNAPASDASGTWVRVGQSTAGRNWGSVFTPRVGQEVLVQFIAGDIDRPVVIGAAYNGRGNRDGQGNQIAAGTAGATANAAAWFPGSTPPSNHGAALEYHAHDAVLAGHKSQELSASQSGAGGYNQWVFDNSSGAGRIELATTSAQTRLQLGHLLAQRDNQRLQPRGHGIDLSTAAWGAVRAGSGLLLSAHGQPGSQSAGRSLDSREPLTRLEEAQALLHSLAESAQRHKAQGTLRAEPDVIGAKVADRARRLPNERALDAAIDSLRTSEQRGQMDDAPASHSGGAGGATAWSRPDLVVAAPNGIAAFTPATSFWSASGTLTMTAGHDLQLATQGHQATAVASGLVFYTYGRTTVAAKPNQETGINFHAASGTLHVEAQTAAMRLAAHGRVEVASTQGGVLIAAAQHILMTAAGAALDIQPGCITLKGPGKMELRASMKLLTGPDMASVGFQRAASKGDLALVKFDDRLVLTNPLGGPVAKCPYRITRADGGLRRGVTDENGHLEPQHSFEGEAIRIELLKTS